LGLRPGRTVDRGARALLGDGYSVIEGGLNGRTTVRDDPVEEHKNGRDCLRPCLAPTSPSISRS
jgi:hypothetical protein